MPLESRDNSIKAKADWGCAMNDSRVVLVTGAGRGLGRAICEVFLAHGDQVIATDVNEELLVDLEGRMQAARLDVTDRQSVNAVAAWVREYFGRLDVLVNNAGLISFTPVAETDPDILIKHFEVNAFGGLRLTHACLDLLIASGGGRVINIGSESWRLRTPFQIYQSTKLAMEGISDVLRRELVHLGVHVAVVRPGAIETDLFHAMDHISNPVSNSRLAEPFGRFAARLGRNPPKKRSKPADVAAVVYRAATEPSRRPHYQINNMPSLKVASWLPTRWVDWLLHRMLGG